MKCLVTGATGFVGRALCAGLLARGHELVAISRSGGSLPDGTPTHPVDFSADRLPPALLEGVDTVFHLAGIAHQRAARNSYAAVNHRATVQLARDAQSAGVGRFIFLSSVKAMGPADTQQARSENDCATPGDDYGLSKWRAECELRSDFDGAAMGVMIIRPALVYAARAKGNLALLQRGIDLGLPRPPEEGGRSMIALADLVDLLCLAATVPCAGVITWIACDGHRYSTRRIYDLLRQQAGKGPGVAWCPRWLWRLAAACHDILFPSAESIWDKLFATELYSNAAVCRALDWAPRLTLEAVLAGHEAGEP